jgi:ribosomal protein S18 acetylase RimI-like enzyme
LPTVIATNVNAAEKNVPVKMTRANLDDLPAFAMSDGFSLRWYRPGDEAHWLRIHLAADRFNQFTPKLFRAQFGLDEVLLSQRQCYLLNPLAEVVGTATAWFKDDFDGARWGRVHWMAIAPEFQGRGLGSALLSAICQRLRELGHERAYLTTSTARVSAIRLYRKFGFEQLVRNGQDERAWRDLIPLAKKIIA